MMLNSIRKLNRILVCIVYLHNDFLGKKLAEYPTLEKAVMELVQRTQEASEAAKQEIKDMDDRKKRGKKRGVDDDTEEASMKFNKRLKKGGAQKSGPISIRKGR